MTVSDRTKFYKLIKREILDIFKDIILCKNEEELQKVTIEFINKGVEN